MTNKFKIKLALTCLSLIYTSATQAAMDEIDQSNCSRLLIPSIAINNNFKPQTIKQVTKSDVITIDFRLDKQDKVYTTERKRKNLNSVLHGDKIAMTITLHTGNNIVEFNEFVRLIRTQFEEFNPQSSEAHAISDRRVQFSFNATYAQEIKQKIKRTVQLLKILHPPQSTSIPNTIAHFSKSEIVQAIRDIVIKFLIKNGIQNNNLFFDHYIATINKQFMNSLTHSEIAVFHYSLFEDFISFEAQIRAEDNIELMNKAAAEMKLGVTYDVDELSTSVKEKLLNITEEYYQIYLEDAEINLSKRIQKENRRVANYTKSVLRNKNLIDQVKSILDINNEKITKIHSDFIATKTYQEIYISYTQEDSKIFDFSDNSEAEYQKNVYALTMHTTTKNNAIRQKYLDKMKGLLVDNERHRSALKILEENKINLVLTNKSKIKEFKLAQEAGIAEYDINKSSFRSNFNPFSMPTDYDPAARMTTITNLYEENLNYSGQKQKSETIVQTIPSSINTHLKEQAPEDFNEISNYGTAADIDKQLSETSMPIEMQNLLMKHGINNVYEITMYSANEYFDILNFNKEEFEKLLFEANALGLHIHFNGNWDKNNMKIRAKHPEFYTHRHTPYLFGKWKDPLQPDKESD